MKVDLSDIDVKLLRIKNEGNALYSKKNFTEAITVFSEGIDLYVDNQDTYLLDKDVKVKVT
jgi:hypothetical protein